jgi:hypothetical protein
MGLRSKLSSADYARLRGYFDSHEPVMMGGLGVSALRQPERKYETPEWMNSDIKVTEFIQMQFPKAGKYGSDCRCDPCSSPQDRLDRSVCECRWCHDTTLAAKFAVVIVHWFRNKCTDTTVEFEFRWKPGTCGSIVQRIRWIIDGKRQDGTARTGNPRGRPKKAKQDQVDSSVQLVGSTAAIN